MKLQRVLVIYRKSLYQIYVEEHAEHSVKRALRRRDSVALALRQSHDANRAALDATLQVLEQRGVEAVVRWRAHVRSTRAFDLVLSVGGDGTLLDISHRIVDGTPLLGVNSDPERSVGALCAADAATLPRLLDELAAGRLRPRRVTRIRVRVDGEEVLGPTLNDVLVAHACPAGLSRFDLALVPAEQAAASHSGYDGAEFRPCRGSGIWVSTAMGSTAAIHSAGGAVLPPSSRDLQYLIREPYRRPGAPRPGTPRGRVTPEHALVLVSRIRQGMIWSDGAHRRRTLGYSQQLMIDRHPSELTLVLPRRRS